MPNEQQLKAEFTLMMIQERYKNDPAMLKQKIEEVKNKIMVNPAILDKIDLPQIKQQQDIEVKRTEDNSQQKQR